MEIPDRVEKTGSMPTYHNPWQHSEAMRPFYKFRGLVRMIVPMGPWAWCVCLKGVKINQSEIWAFLDSEAFEATFTNEDLKSVFKIHSHYGIQLEVEEEAQNSTPHLRTRLKEYQSTRSGIEARFEIIESSESISGLMLEEIESS